MPTAGTESRLYDAIKAALGTIGTPPSSWLTTPSMPDVDGTPQDAINVQTLPMLSLQFFRTDPAAEGAGMARHRARVQFIVWMYAKTTASLLALKADVLRAIFSAESNVSVAFGQPVWPDAFQYHTDMQVAGALVGSLVVFTDVEIDHAAP